MGEDSFRSLSVGSLSISLKGVKHQLTPAWISEQTEVKRRKGWRSRGQEKTEKVQIVR